MKPNFFIVGAPKCGTTSMWAYLRQHPDIFMPKVKEPNYFCSDMPSRHAIWVNKSVGDYLKLFGKFINEKRIGDASVTYLYSRIAAQNIKKFDPNSKIIIMIRNPVDAICSEFHMNVANGVETIFDLEIALYSENYRNLSPFEHETYYINKVRYSKSISRYLKVFDRENIFIIVFDDFIENTKLIYLKTLEFLEIAPTVIPDFKNYLPARVPQNYNIRRFFATHPKLRKIGISLIKEKYRHIILDNISLILGNRDSRKPIITQKVKNRLRSELKSEVENLSILLGRNLTHWTNI